jgi:type IV secretion system protein VirD4
MFDKIKFQPLAISLFLSFILLTLVEWFLGSVILWILDYSSNLSLDVYLLSNPIVSIKKALGIGFIQLVLIFVFFYCTYRIYRLIEGPAYKEAASYGSHGTVRLAKKKELFNDKLFAKKTWNRSGAKNLENPSGLILGLVDNKPLILQDDTEIPNRNVFVVGSPGSGKTQSYIITNIIHEREKSIVVTDPKGEIYETTARLKKKQGYEVHLINFKEMNISDRYNPLDYISKEIEAEQVATSIVLNSQRDKKEDFWAKSEIALLKTLLLYVKYEYPEEVTLAKVKEILTKYNSPKEMDELFLQLDSDHPARQSYMIVRMAKDRVRADIFISLGITLSKFDAKDVRRFTETSDFKLDDIGRKKTILYCILPVADSTWEPIIATFFLQMFQRLYLVADYHFNRLPVGVNILFDEFTNIGKIPNYEEILATCRSYGISISTIVQSLGQLIDKYNSMEKAEAIIGNCGLRFLLGVSDKFTAEYFSELVGKTTIQTQSIKSSDFLSKIIKSGINNTISESYTARNLLTPDELLRLNTSQAILLVSGIYPILVEKAFQFSFFKGILSKEYRTSRFEYVSKRTKQPKELNRKDKTSLSLSKVNSLVVDKKIDDMKERLLKRLEEEQSEVIEKDHSSDTEEQNIQTEEKPKKKNRRKKKRAKKENVNSPSDEQIEVVDNGIEGKGPDGNKMETIH